MPQLLFKCSAEFDFFVWLVLRSTTVLRTCIFVNKLTINITIPVSVLGHILFSPPPIGASVIGGRWVAGRDATTTQQDTGQQPHQSFSRGTTLAPRAGPVRFFFFSLFSHGDVKNNFRRRKSYIFGKAQTIAKSCK